MGDDTGRVERSRTARIAATAKGRLGPPAPAEALRCVVPDPDSKAWLALERASVEGALTWIVTGQHACRAAAERAAALHESPVTHWLLHDATLGWRRSGGRGWMHEPSAATAHSRAEAEAAAAVEPRLTLYVLRASGLITCPDIVPRC